VNPAVVFFLSALALLSLLSGSSLKHLLVDSSFLDSSVFPSYGAYGSALWGEAYLEGSAQTAVAIIRPWVWY
jgi:hypothetical protein